jgi:hypothetical protein
MVAVFKLRRFRKSIPALGGDASVSDRLPKANLADALMKD